MRKTPLIAVALAFIAGLLVAHYVTALPLPVWLGILISGCLIGGITLLFQYKRQNIVFTGILISLIGIGGLLMHLHDPQYDSHHWTQLCPEQAYLTIRANETPLPRAKSYRVKAEVMSVDSHPSHGFITLYLKKDSTAATLHYGDQLMIHSYPNLDERTLYTTSDHYLIIGRDSTSIRARTERLRMSLLHRMQKGPLEKKYAGVAEAMTLGWRGDIDPAINEAFRDSGIMHLLCVSGLHVGLLAALMGGLLFWTGKERRGRLIRGIVQIITIWGFTLLTGLAPSTVRASLMFSLFIISNILARRTERLNLLAAAAIVMLAVKPMLLFDVGWQLSFAAVGGILLAQPAIQAFRNLLFQSAAVSTAATVATLPIMVTTFHRLPLYFLIANIIIVPAAGLLLGLSLLYLAIPCNLTAWPLEQILHFTDLLTTWVSSLPYASVDNITFGPWAIAILTVAVILLLAAPRRILRGA